VASLQPPDPPASERAVLGSVLLEPELIWTARTLLGPDDFADHNCRIAFGEMIAMADRREPVEEILLADRMRASGTLDRVGGVTWLSSLAENAVTSARLEAVARVVSDASLLRRIERFALQTATIARSGTMDARQLAQEIGAKALALCSPHQTGEPEHIRGIVRGAFEALEQLFDSGGALSGISTGFRGLDSTTRGWQKQDLVVIAARPGMGKTAFAMAAAEHAAAAGVPTLVFSLEMAKRQLAMRMLAARARVGQYQFQRGMVSEDEWRATIEAHDAIAQLPLWIDDTARLSTVALTAKARAMKARHGIGLVVVDYLQLQKATGLEKGANREREVSEISQSLKALAKELDVPVIALSQLNRRVEERADKRPMLSDIRESGAVEQDADVVMFLYRDEYYHPETITPGVVEIIIAKQRNGPTDTTVNVGFDKRQTRFFDLEPA
jgi:replicative DNA helicase